VLRSTRARTKAASPPPSLQSEAAEEDSSDGRMTYDDLGDPNASDDPDHVALTDVPSDDDDDDFSPTEELLPSTRNRSSKVAVSTPKTRRKLVKANPYRGRHWAKVPTVQDASSSGPPQRLPTPIKVFRINLIYTLLNLTVPHHTQKQHHSTSRVHRRLPA
jgi:hypothetical protein